VACPSSRVSCPGVEILRGVGGVGGVGWGGRGSRQKVCFDPTTRAGYTVHVVPTRPTAGGIDKLEKRNKPYVPTKKARRLRRHRLRVAWNTFLEQALLRARSGATP
jgi:hypothetical protein